MNSAANNFDSLSEGAFTTSKSGETLFHPYGPTIRPFVVPNEAIRTRLKSRMGLVTGGFIGVVVAHVTGLVDFDMNSVWMLIAEVASLIVVYHILLHTFLGADFKTLKRVEKRLSIAEVAAQYGNQESRRSVGMRFVGCVAFMALGYVGIMADIMRAEIGIACIAVFGCYACFWLIVAYYKPTMRGQGCS